MKRVAIAVTLILFGLIDASRAAGDPTLAPRAWLGLRFHLEAAQEGRSAPFLFVESVVAGGPAEHAGLRKQDIIVELDGKPIAFATNLEALRFFGSLRAGQKVRARVVRNQEKREITLTAIALPDSARAAWDANVTRATAPKKAQ